MLDFLGRLFGKGRRRVIEAQAQALFNAAKPELEAALVQAVSKKLSALPPGTVAAAAVPEVTAALSAALQGHALTLP